MIDHLLNLLSIAIAFVVIEAVWIILLLKFSGFGGYERGREEGYEKGFQDGEIRTHLWWIEQDRQIAEERQRIREEEEQGWRDAS